MLKTAAVLAVVCALLGSGAVHGQANVPAPDPVAGAKPAKVERIKIHGAALEGNLEGDAVDRDALVLLPPSYAENRNRRYPVVYALHGYSIGAEQWSQEIHVPQTLEGAFAKGSRELIVVLPDSKTLHLGSMYSNSATTGNFEDYVARDVVAYMDAHYRTIPQRASRGLVGHSMGGYGASRIGMKHSDVFGALYIMSPCCMSARDGAVPFNGPGYEALAAVKTAADTEKLPFGLRAQLAVGAAWSPNPNNPPLYLDLPVGENEKAVLAKWAANAPLAFVDQYIGNLRQYKAIAIDVGDQDGLRVDAGKLHTLLEGYGIANAFEIYSGTHTSAVAFRFQDYVMPFFSKNLAFEQARR
ncbi:MAG TPA: alpha/beta fold hydrolase [Gammaproteobacteria bacterium]|nr:alpha/beta fold hydrolase [Gammaproteobacteria bacterium]